MEVLSFMCKAYVREMFVASKRARCVEQKVAFVISEYSQLKKSYIQSMP